jgi:hypothetical protein
MDKTREAPLQMPRRFAISLLHQAQLAGEQSFTGVVGSTTWPDLYLPLAEGIDMARALETLRQRERALWAVYLHRPGQPTAPSAGDFAEQPQALRLTSSLATKGVLQLHAWACEDGRVRERELRIEE